MIFLNIFAEKFGEKTGVFGSKQSKIMQKFDHNIGFLRKTPIFWPKIVENYDHNNDPCKLPTSMIKNIHTPGPTCVCI
jgi:hypothetical protein